MTACLGKSYLFGLLCVDFVIVSHFVSVPPSLLVLRVECGF